MIRDNAKIVLFALIAFAIGLALLGLRIATSEQAAAVPLSTEPVTQPEQVADSAQPPSEIVGEPAATDVAELPPEPINVTIEDPGAFTADELDFKDLPVDVELGDYRVEPGQEFEVTIVMSAPALMTFSLHMGFDPVLLEYVPDSAEKVGITFRGDVEFYCRPEMKQMILINTMTPGAKSSTIASRTPVARFRLRAKQTGVTELSVLKKGTFYLNADGIQVADFAISGGNILIQ